ncbi:uncharacterized protein LACBIDRAFT_298374 [Laccaria bicolor S238N-H82]|uniref:Predicted protein n=1 Tax=Laccaria bicolor (strain S238N-H82 / ATCC MYA-4686) TaxID=486041 RepID=B0E3D8_LACBS|nr:uncharacterized protein LACBIDRAFT_298374 [Laccaria bicolor S238N-H82]EDQ98638.1 predicted protein [Laccaria bicolor S238N-H82]|eukprot:XP_001890704.1 predicted protein [Laccaria bicolor S238N-H82]
MAIAGPAAAALASLKPDQVTFLQSLEKAELHAHLNGSIPIAVIQQLGKEYVNSPSSTRGDAIYATIERLIYSSAANHPWGTLRIFKHFSVKRRKRDWVSRCISPSTPEETLKLLSFQPDRLGHATFLNKEAMDTVIKNNICVEICLNSNLLSKTVTALESHHIRQYLKENHLIAICTDDILPFRTSLLAEYALLLAQPPLGLGLTQDEVKGIGEMSLRARFTMGSS